MSPDFLPTGAVASSAAVFAPFQPPGTSTLISATPADTRFQQAAVALGIACDELKVGGD